MQRVQEKTGALWSVPFLLGAIFAQRAFLYRLVGEASAWIVVERLNQGKGPWMNVWVLEGDGLEHAEQIFPLLDDLAKGIGCDRWRCEGRKGWGKWLPTVATVFERKCV